MNPAAEQIEAIHAMMETGHRSVRLEWHTLILWGLTTAALILLVQAVFTAERFSEPWVRVMAANLFITLVLVTIAIGDFRLTLRARRSRDETLSFVQLQVTKVWWLLVALIVAIHVGMQFFGGGYMFYGVLNALVGIAFFIHGLFSRQMLAWIGSFMIVVGLGSIALRLPLVVMEWLTIVIFGFGLPLLGWLLNSNVVQATKQRRFTAVAIWMLLILLITTVIYQVIRAKSAEEPPLVSLSEYQAQATSDIGQRVVRMPSGTRVPVEVRIDGDIVSDADATQLTMILAKDLDVRLVDGKPTGKYRVGNGDWRESRFNLRIFTSKLDTELSRLQGPSISLRLNITADK